MGMCWPQPLLVGRRWMVWMVSCGLLLGCTPAPTRVAVTVRVAVPADFTMAVGQSVNAGGDYIVQYESESASAVHMRVDMPQTDALRLVREPVVIVANSDAPERGQWFMPLQAMAAGTVELELTPVGASDDVYVVVPESMAPPPYRVRVTVQP